MAVKKEIIASIAKKLNKLNIRWALIGSANLALQGMNISPKDLDILIKYSDKEKVIKMLKGQEIISSSMLESGEAEEIKYFIDGVEVQFCCEYPHGFYYKFLRHNKIVKIRLGSEEVLCNSLEDEMRAYEYTGRKERAKEIKEFLEAKINSDLFEKILSFANNAYHNHNVMGQKYRPGGPMPYMSHPLWCATMLANDRRLPLKIRAVGFQALVLHDVLEDTTEKIPKWISHEVKELVQEMTFKDWEEKKNVVPVKSKFVKLLLLVDGLASMYEETVGEHKRKEFKQQVEYLLNEAKKNYPKSRIIEIGKTIVEKTNW